MTLPIQLWSSYETMRLALGLPEQAIFVSSSVKSSEMSKSYNYAFWQRTFHEWYPESSLKGLRAAYYQACLGAWQLDRWKIKLESFPAWVRRLPEVRYIDEHTKTVMAQATKFQHRSEAVGLAMARMETLERKVKKRQRLNLLIAGDSRLLGDKEWCRQLEEILPKKVRYRFSYSYCSLLRGSSLVRQLFWEAADFKPVLYDYRNGLWTVKTMVGFDGLIWAGGIASMPKTNKAYVVCSENLGENEHRNILRMSKNLQEKKFAQTNFE